MFNSTSGAAIWVNDAGGGSYSLNFQGFNFNSSNIPAGNETTVGTPSASLTGSASSLISNVAYLTNWSVASLGSTFVVAYETAAPGSSTKQVYMQEFSSAGTPMGLPVQVASNMNINLRWQITTDPTTNTYGFAQTAFAPNNATTFMSRSVNFQTGTLGSASSWTSPFENISSFTATKLSWGTLYTMPRQSAVDASSAATFTAVDANGNVINTFSILTFGEPGKVFTTALPNNLGAVAAFQDGETIHIVEIGPNGQPISNYTETTTGLLQGLENLNNGQVQIQIGTNITSNTDTLSTQIFNTTPYTTYTTSQIAANLTTINSALQNGSVSSIVITDPNDRINVSQAAFIGNGGVFGSILNPTGLNLQTHGTTLYDFGLPYGISPKNFDINGAAPQFVTPTNAGVVLGSSSVTMSQYGTDSTQYINLTEYADSLTLTADQSAVLRLYQAALARSPDLGGLTYWANNLQAGGNEADLASDFLSSPEFQSKYGNLSNGDYVTALYNNVLGRSPDSAGYNYWTSELNGGLGRAQVLLDFSNSSEFEAATQLAAAGFESNQIAPTDIGIVYRLYQSALDRVPDASGLQYWSQQLMSGAETEAQLAQNFTSSSEFQSKYGSLSNGDYVNALYNNVLGRSADSSGYAYWTNALGNGMTRAQLLVAFNDSAEFEQNTNAALSTFMQTTGPWINTLDVGGGNNRIAMGVGSTELVVNANVQNPGQDQVYGLNAWSWLDFANFGYSTTADAMTHMTQSGGDVLFSDSNHPNVSIDFHNTNLNVVTAALNNTPHPF